MKKVNALLALTLAAAAGAAVGMLVAPRKGKQTRENIKDFMKSHTPALRHRRLEALADQMEREAKKELAR